MRSWIASFGKNWRTRLTSSDFPPDEGPRSRLWPIRSRSHVCIRIWRRPVLGPWPSRGCDPGALPKANPCDKLTAAGAVAHSSTGRACRSLKTDVAGGKSGCQSLLFWKSFPITFDRGVIRDHPRCHPPRCIQERSRTGGGHRRLPRQAHPNTQTFRLDRHSPKHSRKGRSGTTGAYPGEIG